MNDRWKSEIKDVLFVITDVLIRNDINDYRIYVYDEMSNVIDIDVSYTLIKQYCDPRTDVVFNQQIDCETTVSIDLLLYDKFHNATFQNKLNVEIALVKSIEEEKLIHLIKGKVI